MKDYLVTIKCINTTSVMVKASNKKEAKKKVEGLFKNHIKNNTIREKIFSKSPDFKYKIIRK